MGNAHLLMIGLHAAEIGRGEIPPRNLVFLLDVSGSMKGDAKLPLLKRAMVRLTRNLRVVDSVAIVTYSSKSAVVLAPTRCADESKGAILKTIKGLAAGGGTNGGAGIETAYRLAQKHFDPEGINRVILGSDGDFNVGTTSREALQTLIEKNRQTGVFLTVVGLGTGNLKDHTMEMLANKGNGHYLYLDSSLEARKAFDRQLTANLVTVAKDVKIQVEFNPANVRAYRLIGYENRGLADDEFNDDRSDSGEMGAGHTVTALYEIVPTRIPGVDPLRYQPPAKSKVAAVGIENEKPVVAGVHTAELCQVKVRYKRPADASSRRLTAIVASASKLADGVSKDLQFASAVAAFGLVLRNSQYKGSASYDLVRQLAKSGLGADSNGDRHEFLRLVDLAEDLDDSVATGAGK